MNWKIKDLIAETKEPLRRGYWKITSVSFLLIILMTGMSYTSLISSINELPELVRNIISNEFAPDRTFDGRMLGIILTLAGGILFLSLLIHIVLDIFLDNTLRVGAYKMFVSALDEKKNILLADLASAFDANYLNVVKIMLLKTICTYAWMLLLIVPGVMKIYEYQLIPYLLAEDPHMSRKEAFAKSKQMMKGYKMKAFLMDLYFLVWHILGILTFGIAELFYVAPKVNLVNADFYLKVKEANELKINE